MKSIFSDIFYRLFQAIFKQLYMAAIVYHSMYTFGGDVSGTYIYLFALVNSISLFIDFGLSTSLANNFVGKEDRTVFEKLFVNLAFLSCMVSICFSIITYLYYYDWLVSILLGLCLILAPLSSLMDGYQRSKTRFQFNSKLNFYSSMLALIVYFCTYGIIGYISLYLSSFVFYLSLMLLHSIEVGVYRIRILPKMVYFKECSIIYKDSLYLGVAAIGLLLYTRVDIIVLGCFNLYSSISTYELIDKVVNSIILPGGFVAQVVAPRLIKMKDRQHVYYYCFLIISLSLAFLYCLLFYSFYDDVYIMFVKRFEEIGVTEFIYFLSALIIPLRLFSILQTGVFLNPFGYSKIVAYTTILFGLVNVVLDVVFVVRYGFDGVYLSTVILVCLATITQTTIYNVQRLRAVNVKNVKG